MKRHSSYMSAMFLAVSLSLLRTPLAYAEADANAQLSFLNFSITPGAGMFSLTSLQGSAFASAGVNSQFNSGNSPIANANGDYSLAHGAAAFPGTLTLNVSGTANSGVSIPGQTAASDQATSRGTISGQFMITGGSGQVSTVFSLPITGSVAVFTDAYGRSAQSETIMTLELNGSPILFNDSLLAIGPSDHQLQGISTTLSDTVTLNYNQEYIFNLEADAETFASNIPEPRGGTLLLISLGLLWLGRTRAKRRASRNTRASRAATFFLAAGLLPVWFANDARAIYIGADAPDVCLTCGVQPTRWPAGAISTSLTEGNLREDYLVASLQSAGGPTVQLSLTYNSYNADDSKAQVDTGLGWGWTHSYNIFLFQQRSHLFKMGPDGRVTQYRSGSGSGFTTDPGYFETLTETSPGNFVITNKEQSWWRFAPVPNTPFLVAGPVYRLIQMGDRNNNVTSLTYSNGLLVTITDTYGRSLTLGYNPQNKLTTITDPLGRVTTIQYDSLYRSPVAIIDPAGKTVQYTYNPLYQMTRKIDRDGRSYLYMYKNQLPYAITDGSGQPYFSLTNPGNWAVDRTNLALVLRRNYFPATTTQTDGRGNLWRYQYDTNGYVTEVIAPDGATTSYSYDPGTLRVTSITNADGFTTSYRYDAQGNRTNTTDALGNITTYTYEPVYKQMTSMTDPNGRTTTYHYDSFGNRTSQIDPLGQTNRWTYDTHGNVLTDTDRNGHTTMYQYDATGNRTNQTDALGNVTRYTYDADGNRLSMTDANSHTTTYTYDALNRVTGVTNSLGGITRYTYDALDRQTGITDPNTNTTSYGYDVRGRVASVTNAIGGTTIYQYDPDDNRISTTDPLGRVTTYQYDTRNRDITVTNPIGGITRYTYDPVGNRLTDTDPNTNTTTYSYDALNRQVTMTNSLVGVTTYDYATPGGPPCCSPTVGSSLITRLEDPDGHVTFYKYDELDRRVKIIRKQGDTNDVINPLDAVTVYVYDPVGNRITDTDPVTNTTTYVYDALNRLSSMTNAAGDTTVYAYDPVGNVITTVSPNTNVTTTVYDALNRATLVYDAVGVVSSNAYDPVGNVLSRTDANGHTTSYQYDGLNRRTAEVDPLGHPTTTTYDAVGNVTNRTDRLGHTSTYQYDGLDRQTSTTDPLGNTSITAYDAVGNLTSRTDANSHTTSYQYDALNRRVTQTLPDPVPNTITYQYDAVGNLLIRTNQRGQTITYSYSDLNFVTNRSYSPGGATDTMTYDLDGRVLTANRGAWMESFTYDGANRMLTSIQEGRTITYAYDIAGRTATNDYPSGRQIITMYDARNRIVSERDGTNAPLVTYAYDDANLVTARDFHNGVTATYKYDPDNRVTSIEHSNTVGRIAGFAYSYDFEGNKLYEQKTDSTTNSETYSYDAANRLTTYDVGTLVVTNIPSPVKTESWSLDGVGNWLTNTVNFLPQTRTHGPANELLTAGPNTYTYDADGNLSADPAYTYSYDEENRLTRVERVSDSAIVGRYFYDAFGRRVGEVIFPAGILTTNYYYYDQKRIIEERDGAGATEATFTYGNYIDETLTMDRGGQTYYYHQNALWSTLALSDTTGAPVERYTYDVYGRVTEMDASYNPIPLNGWGTPHSAAGNFFLFTGRQLDEETGLYFYRARYYDAGQGRFIQRDPLEYVDGLNLYEYGHDRPTLDLDPNGTICICGLPLVVEIHFPSPPAYNTAAAAAVCGVYTTPPCNKLVHATVCNNAGGSCYANCVRGCLRADWNPAICDYNRGDITRHAECFHYCDFVCHGGVKICNCPGPCAPIRVP